MPPGEHVVEVAGRQVVVHGDGRPGALTVDGLPPATRLDVSLDGHPVLRVRTLAPPPGRELARVATLSDLHIGDGDGFGVLPTVRAEGGPPQRRCIEAALAEIRAWGADVLVVKGDVTHDGTPRQWEEAAELLASAGVPVVATVGNHDRRRGAVDGTEVLGAAGIPLARGGVVVHDVPGLRIVVADATTNWHHGSYRRVGAQVLDAAAAATGGVLVAQHHQIHGGPLPTHWPPGIVAPTSLRFLRELADANPATVVTSGHTHRCRARRRGPVLVTEVGSPKDHPGVWAGYAVHEGGLRQVVHRIAEPDVLCWTEDTARALLGVWGRWSPGRLDDRCLSHTWPVPAPGARPR